jgi:tRNA uridine 5-carboxymethylaminomethyl modification enzyme
MKTGTPARIRRSSIDYSRLAEQPGDDPIRPFSFRTKEIKRSQISCWLTNTNATTHEIIQANIERSPLFNGQIESTGPRYCPSIEDKVYRFRDKLSHNIFLEPEGWDSDIVYPNGISTSLPRDVQDAFLRSIQGLEAVEVIRYGYAVEYDHILPTQLTTALDWPELKGLYFAGQINGTSGYEEAGAQGLVAGVNAARFTQGKAPLILGRDQAYIGVMIDDLTTLGVAEPYRMFTSRAEYRLHLREDNADERLTPIARELGMVGEGDWRNFSQRQDRIQRETSRMESTFEKPTADANAWLKELGSAQIADGISLATLLRRPEIQYADLASRFPGVDELSPYEAERVETVLKFSGYLKRQEQEIAKLKKMESVRIPHEFSYELQGLSIEVQQRLGEVRPDTLGQASRVSGVTPAALSLIAIHLRRSTPRKAA